MDWPFFTLECRNHQQSYVPAQELSTARFYLTYQRPGTERQKETSNLKNVFFSLAFAQSLSLMPTSTLSHTLAQEV